MKTIVKWHETDGFMHVELHKGADFGRAGIKFYNSVKVPAGLMFNIRFRARGNGKIWFGNGGVNINCGVKDGGYLGCLRLDDMKEFYV